MRLQCPRQEFDQGGECRWVGSVQARRGVLPSKDRVFMAEHQDLGVFGRVGPAEERQPAGNPAEHEVDLVGGSAHSQSICKGHSRSCPRSATVCDRSIDLPLSSFGRSGNQGFGAVATVVATAPPTRAAVPTPMPALPSLTATAGEGSSVRTYPILRGVVTVVLAMAGGAVAASPAHADTGAEEPTVRTARFSAAELSAASQRGDLAAAASPKLRQRVTEHLGQQVRAGRLLDERAVKVAVLPDPFKRGAAIHTVWDSASVPQSIVMVRADFADGGNQVGMGVESSGDPATAEAANGPTATGSGFGAGTTPKNMYKQNNGCTDTWFVPGYSSTRDHKMTSCWEWWAQSGTVHWVYNRWLLWTPAVPSAGSYRTTDLYAASRPWAGYESRVAKLNDWEPRSLSATCFTAATAKLGGTFGGITGEVSIPYQKCEDYWLDISASARKIGIDYQLDDSTNNGRTGQMYMDVAGDFNASNSTVVPIMADYNWATVRSCTGPQTVCSKTSFVHKDSGW